MLFPLTLMNKTGTAEDLGRGVDFCSGQVKSEMSSDIQMEKSGRQRGRNV